MNKIQKFERNLVFKKDSSNDPSFSLITAQHVYDKIAEKITFKEENHYLSRPFENVANDIKYSQEWDPKFNDKNALLKELNSCLPNQNQGLKNEYIDLVKEEKENELMKFIMSGL